MFEVIVGNIGTVYSGNNFVKASSIFSTYKRRSKDGEGRAAGEDVTMFHNGEPRLEYVGQGET